MNKESGSESYGRGCLRRVHNDGSVKSSKLWTGVVVEGVPQDHNMCERQIQNHVCNIHACVYACMNQCVSTRNSAMNLDQPI